MQNNEILYDIAIYHEKEDSHLVSAGTQIVSMPGASKLRFYSTATLYAISGIFLSIFLMNVINVNLLHMKIATTIAQNKTISVNLTKNQIAHLANKDKIQIYLSIPGKSYTGKISEMHVFNGFIGPNNAQYLQQDSKPDRYTRVTININELDKADFNKNAFAGMPVTVYFPRRLVSSKTGIKEGVFYEN